MDPLLLHRIGHAKGVLGSTPAWLTVCAAAGLVAALAMDYPMSAQPDGFAPAYVAAGVVTRRRPDSVPLRDALVVHHLAGPLAGLPYGGLTLAFARLFPETPAVAGVPFAAHVLATATVVAFVYGFFSYLVFPRADAGRYEEAATAVRGQWLRSTLVFGAAMAAAVPGFVSLLS